MFAPRWMDTKCQPIAIANVVEYLAACLEHPQTRGEVYEIGGPDVLSWRELFHIYSDEAGLPRRLVLVLPLRIHAISIWWMNLVTPVSVALIRPLIERMREEVLCNDTRIREIIPQRLLSCREAIVQALSEFFREQVASSCYDAGSTHLPDWAGGEEATIPIYRDIFSITIDGPPQHAWDVVNPSAATMAGISAPFSGSCAVWSTSCSGDRGCHGAVATLTRWVWVIISIFGGWWRLRRRPAYCCVPKCSPPARPCWNFPSLPALTGPASCG